MPFFSKICKCGPDFISTFMRKIMLLSPLPDTRQKTHMLPWRTILYRFSFLLWAICGSLPGALAQQNRDCDLSKQYAIDAAQLADQSYASSARARFSANAEVANRHIDTAIYYIRESVTAMDSALAFANDTDIVAAQFAVVSKKEAHDASGVLLAARRSPSFSQKLDYAEQAALLSQHATVDAYHASFYFTGKCPPPPEKSTPEQLALAEELLDKAGFEYNLLPIHVTKLDVDQSLFSLLMVQLSERSTENTREMEKIELQLKTEKSLTKAAKLKQQLAILRDKDKEFTQKNKEVSEKLSQINSQISTRDKNAAAGISETTAFSRSINPSTQWGSQVLIDKDMPKGLVYQVQIGVYKNVITPQLFKGLTPLYGKTVPNGISYATGMFEKLEDATEAKNYVRSMGLTDAFVIAFYNNKQVSVAEAQKLEQK